MLVILSTRGEDPEEEASTRGEDIFINDLATEGVFIGTLKLSGHIILVAAV